MDERRRHLINECIRACCRQPQITPHREVRFQQWGKGLKPHRQPIDGIFLYLSFFMSMNDSFLRDDNLN